MKTLGISSVWTALGGEASLGCVCRGRVCRDSTRKHRMFEGHKVLAGATAEVWKFMEVHAGAELTKGLGAHVELERGLDREISSSES